MGDGCLSTYWDNSNKRQRYEIAFTGHLDDFDYYEKVIQPIFKKNFSASGRLYKRGNTTRYHIRSKRIFEFFKELGVPVGIKKNSKMQIPQAIKENNKLTKAFIRGLWDTDGSIYRRYSKKYKGHGKIYDYVNLQLKMMAPVLIKQVNKFLREEKIKTNKITKSEGESVLRITDQKSVKKFAEKIGFSNPRYQQKFENLFPKPTALGS